MKNLGAYIFYFSLSLLSYASCVCAAASELYAARQLLRDALLSEEEPDAEALRSKIVGVKNTYTLPSTTATIDFEAIVKSITSNSSYVKPCLSGAGLWDMFACELEANKEFLQNLAAERNGTWSDTDVITYLGVRTELYTILYLLYTGFRYGNSLSLLTEDVCTYYFVDVDPGLHCGLQFDAVNIELLSDFNQENGGPQREDFDNDEDYQLCYELLYEVVKGSSTANATHEESEYSSELSTEDCMGIFIDYRYKVSSGSSFNETALLQFANGFHKVATRCENLTASPSPSSPPSMANSKSVSVLLTILLTFVVRPGCF